MRCYDPQKTDWCRLPGKSGVRGVSYTPQKDGEKVREYWTANIKCKGKFLRKLFKNIEDAIAQRKAWEIEFNFKQETTEQIVARKKLQKKIKDQKYRNKNKAKINENNAEYVKNRLKTDIQFKLMRQTRTSFNNAMRRHGFTKRSMFTKLLKCSWEFFKSYIEKQFESWMNWNNRGMYVPDGPRSWQIDHIISLSTAKTQEEYEKLWHYTNLRPYCSKANIIEGARKIVIY